MESTTAVGFPQNYFPPNCQPPRFQSCRHNWEISALLFFTQAMWPGGVNFSHVPPEQTAGLLRNETIATMFALAGVHPRSLSNYDISNGIMLGEPGVFFFKSHPIIKSKIVSAAFVFQGVLRILNPLAWQVWLVVTVTLVVIAVLEKHLFLNFPQVSCLLFEVSLVACMKFYEAKLTALTALPPTPKPPFQSLEQLASLVQSGSLKIGMEYLDEDHIPYMIKNSNESDPLFPLKTALSHNHPILFHQETERFCMEVRRPNVVSFVYLHRMRFCHPECFYQFPQIERYFQKHWAGIVFRKGSSKLLQRANIFTEATRGFIFNYQRRHENLQFHCEDHKKSKTLMDMPMTVSVVLLIIFGAMFSLSFLIAEIAAALKLKRYLIRKLRKCCHRDSYDLVHQK